MITLSLPFPISVNSMYANVSGKGRIKSQRYRTWRSAAGWALKAAKQTPINGWFTVTIILYEKDNRKRDPDNFVKGVNDLLVEHKLIEDDSYCSSFSVERIRSNTSKCEVIIRPSNGIIDERNAA